MKQRHRVLVAQARSADQGLQRDRRHFQFAKSTDQGVRPGQPGMRHAILQGQTANCLCHFLRSQSDCKGCPLHFCLNTSSITCTLVLLKGQVTHLHCQGGESNRHLSFPWKITSVDAREWSKHRDVEFEACICHVSVAVIKIPWPKVTDKRKEFILAHVSREMESLNGGEGVATGAGS